MIPFILLFLSLQKNAYAAPYGVYDRRSLCIRSIFSGITDESESESVKKRRNDNAASVDVNKINMKSACKSAVKSGITVESESVDVERKRMDTTYDTQMQYVEEESIIQTNIQCTTPLNVTVKMF